MSSGHRFWVLHETNETAKVISTNSKSDQLPVPFEINSWIVFESLYECFCHVRNIRRHGANFCEIELCVSVERKRIAQGIAEELNEKENAASEFIRLKFFW